jgi:hypothetical protein
MYVISATCLDLTIVHQQALQNVYNTGLFISPSGISDPCGTVAGTVTPKGIMSTEGETLQHALQRVSQELDYRIDICRVNKGAHIEHL